MSNQFAPNVLQRLRVAEVTTLETHSSSGQAIRTPMWAVVEGSDLYMRSAYGQTSQWYQRIRKNLTGSVYVDGFQLAIRAFPVTDPDVISRVNQAYLHKYQHVSYARSIVEPAILSTTLRLEPVSQETTVQT